MDKKAIERMKQLIEEKKNKGTNNEKLRPDKSIGHVMGAKISKKSGGLFDK
ncbi:hypothetical protein [Hathewaya massiliensis]|uniref:hypothetical protein n=1 Tax=Hathewaya massiliensis TaxID=1964382 RepID=UPI00163C0ACD|nr:hypothetical protein [Hathewaya massiliensis]